MFNLLNPNAPPPSVYRVAAELRWIGWLGFWLQLILGFVPIALAVFFLLIPHPSRQGTGGADLGFFFSYAALFALIFTIYWCFRYTQLAKKLEDRDLRPSKSEVIRCLYIGLLVNLAGMAFAVIVALSEVGSLLVRILSLPQGATTVLTPTQGGAVLSRLPITSFELMGLQAVISAIAAELIGLIVSLWLLHRISQRPAQENPNNY